MQEGSAYLKDKSFARGKVYLSDGYMEKYGFKKGRTLTLSDKYSGKEYDFEIDDEYEYPPTLCVFMNIEDFNETFGLPEDYFTGYFSNEKITDIDEAMIASVITERELNVMADQLEDSLGMIFPFFGGFAILIYILLIYLLAKLVVEKNASSISMIKILGYSDGEISKIYARATFIAATASMIISVPLSLLLIRFIYFTMMQQYSGWLTFWVAPWIAPGMIGVGLLCYAAASFSLLRRIKKIPLAQALKTAE